MVYVPTNWLNDQPPPIDEANLNKMEQGLIDAHATVLYARYILGLMTPQWLGGTTFGAAGRVHLVPIDVPWPIIIDRIIYQVGGTSAGNVRLGIYREGSTPDSPLGAALVVESASVAQSAVDGMQMVTVADTLVVAGQYFVAIQGDDPTGTAYKSQDDNVLVAKNYNRAGGYGPFTDPCPALGTGNSVFWFLLRVKENRPIMS